MSTSSYWSGDDFPCRKHNETEAHASTHLFWYPKPLPESWDLPWVVSILSPPYLYFIKVENYKKNYGRTVGTQKFYCYFHP